MGLISRKTEGAGGFTLIELLVVVFLIGLISGFAVLSVSTRGYDKEIEDQLKLLQYQLTIASEESVIQGSPIGVQFDQDKYYFLIAGKAKWLEFDDGKVFQARELLRNWKFELQVHGENLPLLEVEGEDAEIEFSPQIIFYSSGEIDPFAILVIDENHTPKFQIKYGNNGMIVLESIGEG